MTPVSEEVLSRYYQMQRLADDRNQARTTIRLLESMVRLAQAHARLMCRTEVTLQDAVSAIIVMESTMQGTALLPETHVLHASFPVNPQADVRKRTKKKKKKRKRRRRREEEKKETKKGKKEKEGRKKETLNKTISTVKTCHGQ